MKRNWNKIADICETVIVIMLAVILLVMTFTQSEPVDVYNMPVEEAIRSEQKIF